MSEQVGTHSVPLGGGDDRERPPELETPRSAAAPFEPVGAVPHVEEQPRGRGWRPWAIIGVAIAVPAAVAAVLVTTLGGSDTPAAQQAAQTPAPTPIVQQTTTAPPPAAAAAPVRAAAPAAPDRTAAPAGESTLTVSRADAAAAESANQSAATDAAAASTVAAELATPEERLSAWADMTQVTIVEGDSLWALAIEYGTTVEAISFVNAVNDPAELSVGSVLSIPVGFAESLVPAETAAVEETAGSAETAASMATRFETVPPADTPLADWPNIVEWTIQPGDSLSALATTFETNADAIMSLNGISDPDLLYAGSTIRIPVGFTGNAPAVETTETTTQTAAATEPDTTTQAVTPTETTETGETTTTTQSVTPTETTETGETTTTTQSVSTDAADQLEEANAPATGSTDTEDDYLEGAAAPTETTANDDYLESSNTDDDYLEN